MNHSNPLPIHAGVCLHTHQRIVIRPYTTTELASLYGVCPRTLVKWLNPFHSIIGERIGRFYTSLQVELIFMKLGMPYTIWEEI